MSNEVMNPYGDNLPAAQQKYSGSTGVEVSRATSEVQAMVVMAKRFPRSPIEAMDRILIECQRPKLASDALYSYSRGGTDISGPSIRLAEVIARNWGNLDSGVKELSREGGESEMMSYCWDLESNVRQTKIFTVEHKRDTKKGSYKLTDSRDIYEVTANNAARRLRACILAVIPSDVIDAAVQQCEETLKASADTSPEALKKMVEAFDKFGVKQEHIETRIQRKLESITPAQVISLRKIHNSLRDGMSKPSDWFEVEDKKEPSQAAAELSEKIKADAGKKEPPAPNGSTGKKAQASAPHPPEKAIAENIGKLKESAAIFDTTITEKDVIQIMTWSLNNGGNIEDAVKDFGLVFDAFIENNK